MNWLLWAIVSLAAVWLAAWLWMELVTLPLRLWRWTHGEGWRD